MKQSFNLLLPFSIIVAGLLIGLLSAGAIIYTNRSGSGGALTTAAVEELSYLPITTSDHIRGNIDAPVRLIDYSDLECPFCKRHHTTLIALSETYDTADFAWIYRHFAIPSLHRLAVPESVASECVALQAGSEGFWHFIDAVYEITPSNDGFDLSLLPDLALESGVTDLEAFEVCYDNQETLDHVEAEMADATSARGNGTPYGLIVSDRSINNRTRTAIFKELQKINAPQLLHFSSDRTAVGLSGALPYETLKAVLDILIAYNK